MHIPGFGRTATVLESKHVISLQDNSETVDQDEDNTGLSPAPSREIEAQAIPDVAVEPHHAIKCGDGLVEILYENQRGSFLCGMPLFSSAGLWITDPHAWTNIDHKYTPFTIFNATLPDPTWEWDWKRWYVDMSGDVDENGWMYNLNFTKHHWHGHHIWYHSFVRRRRWLRKRKKVQSSDRVQRKLKNPAEDYFTIYSASHKDRQPRQDHSIDGVLHAEDEDDEEEVTKLENLGDFYERLRDCRLDREKIEALDNFLQNGTDLSALAGEMRRILGYLIFQQSKRQLLTLLTIRCQNLEKSHEGDRHQCVQNAVDMAETLITQLEYWSDQVKLTKAEEEAELDRLEAIHK